MIKLILAFLTIFISELGCKTQITTLLLSSNKNANILGIFILTSIALLLANALAAYIGSFGAKYLDMIPLRLISGIGFVAIGVFSIFEHFKFINHTH
jgi:putative Ca2+/H+ antiporter (TMEM165/GDT1 family)